MVNIRGAQVDVVGGIDKLSEEWAIFTIEFEHDAKIMVHHTFGHSVYRELNALIRKTLTTKFKIPELIDSLVNSKYLTVEIKEVISSKSTIDVLKRKYELIDKYQSYAPYGHNYLRMATGKELIFSEELMQQLAFRIHIPENMIMIEESPRRGKDPKPVYQYDKNTGVFNRSFQSIREAFELTGICASNINMCCNGRIKSAGGYIWSYDKTLEVETPNDRRKKEPMPLPTKEERAKLIRERQLDFIKKNYKTKEQQEEEDRYKVLKIKNNK